MTREEAITIIGNLEDKDILYNPCDVQDAKTMAIKALEQEPSGDTISRQAVLDAIEDDNRIGMWSCFVSDDDAQKFKTVIKKLPSVKQEPFINKPCVSSEVCEHDKNKVLDKIRAEIDGIEINGQTDEHTMFIRTGENVKQMALDIIDKYRK